MVDGAKQGDRGRQAGLGCVGVDLADALAPVFRGLDLEDGRGGEDVCPAVTGLGPAGPASWLASSPPGGRGSLPSSNATSRTDYGGGIPRQPCAL